MVQISEIHPLAVVDSSNPEENKVVPVKVQPNAASCDEVYKKHNPSLVIEQPLTLDFASHNMPRGLDYLQHLDYLLIEQQIELIEIIFGFETKNKYRIMNRNHQQFAFAAEESNCLCRNCCGRQREFMLHITDNGGFETMRFQRPFKLVGCCSAFGLCKQEIFVEAPVGRHIGQIWQECSFCTSSFIVRDFKGNDVFRVKGPCDLLTECRSCCEVSFPYYDMQGRMVGEIHKVFAGILKECCTDAQSFYVTFPKNLDVLMKANMLAAAFMIDFMFFEGGDGCEI